MFWSKQRSGIAARTNGNAPAANGAFKGNGRIGRPPPAPRFHPHQPRMPHPVTFGPNRVALVATAGEATVLRDLVAPTDPALAFAIGKLPEHVKSYTNYAAGLRVSLDLLEKVGPGIQRHIYIAADGEDNMEREGLDAQIERAKQMRVRIYATPIGCDKAGHSFNLSRLQHVADATGGKLKPISTLKAMAEHYEGLAARGGRNLGQSVAKVLLADVSPSMQEPWDKTTKLAALQFSFLRFLAIEQKRQ